MSRAWIGLFEKNILTIDSFSWTLSPEVERNATRMWNFQPSDYSSFVLQASDQMSHLTKDGQCEYFDHHCHVAEDKQTNKTRSSSRLEFRAKVSHRQSRTRRECTGYLWQQDWHYKSFLQPRRSIERKHRECLISNGICCPVRILDSLCTF